MEVIKEFYAKSRKDWRNWLRRNHKREKKVNLIKVQSFIQQLPIRRAEMTKAMTKEMDGRIATLRNDYENTYNDYQRGAISEWIGDHMGWRDTILEQATYLGKY